MMRLIVRIAVCVALSSAIAAGWLWLAPGGQESAVARITQLGGKVRFDESRGDRPVIGVDLSDCPAGEGDLIALNSFPHLQYLILTGSNIDDDGLKHLAKMKELRRLDVGGPGISDAGLAHLTDLSALEELTLSSPRITDAGLIHLQKLKNLRELNLTDSGVSDSGIEHLQQLTQLRELDVSHTRISEAGLARLKKALPDAFIYRTP